MKVSTIALAVVLMGTVFVLLPAALVELNAALGWPRWQSAAARHVGGVLMLAGITAAFHCLRLFRHGGGTPVPTEPPSQLVVSSLYQYSRNPIFVADVAILVGLFLHRGELSLLLYAGLVTVFLHALVVLREEPELRRRFGEDYARYERAVPRWITPVRRTPRLPT
jgi:protein-S-isoprenylcysteine O-methyltransferase Ste14